MKKISFAFFKQSPLVALRKKAEAKLEQIKERFKILIINDASEEKISRMQTAMNELQEGIQMLDNHISARRAK